jgi:polyphosphate kinase
MAAGAERNPPSSEDPPDIRAMTRYLNREVSWLDFNARVLALAEDPTRPLLERVKFSAICARNLDEFFQIRVAGLKQQQRLGDTTPSPDGLTPAEQLRLISEVAGAQAARATALFRDDLRPSLEQAGIRFYSPADLEDRDRKHVESVYRDRIFPVLTPLAVDPAHPFPYISNLSLNLAVMVRDPGTSRHRFARIKVPPLLPRFVPLAGEDGFVPVEEVIAHHLDSLFPGMQVIAHHPFRLTRNADLDLEEEKDADLLSAIEEELRRQRRGAQVVRLEIVREMPREMRDLLARELELGQGDLYVMDGPLDLGGLWSMYNLDRPELKDEAWRPTTQAHLSVTDDLLAVLRDRDILVHHPYDSFASSVEAFVERAASDPQVLAIKQTLYRTSGQESPIVRALIRAAESGKQAVALVEVKARFEEQANIGWARTLEEAGVHVVYGVVGLKTHAKVSLVVRVEEDGIRRYSHVGTGNYNPTTATMYEDVGLLTADPEMGADLSDLFNYLTGYSRKRKYRRLLVSPLTLRETLTDLIQKECHPDGRIVIKVNNLVDTEIVDALYAAAQAGARIDLIVRSICSLRPGVAGLSGNIRVRSILGRYLEHSRIFVFGSEAQDPTYYIGSADLMPRNLDRRVEAIAPVMNPELRARLAEIIEVNLADDRFAWELRSDGTWTRAGGDAGISSQTTFQDAAVKRLADSSAEGARA